MSGRYLLQRFLVVLVALNVMKVLGKDVLDNGSKNKIFNLNFKKDIMIVVTKTHFLLIFIYLLIIQLLNMMTNNILNQLNILVEKKNLNLQLSMMILKMNIAKKIIYPFFVYHITKMSKKN